ncbi:hypothetical protein QA584_22270 [Anaerocolumna sp. AGMB13025]|uniref:hypothetical protein n=1 Tax=Anaerocolumna sp. AGMB13025 TaxID=3039116 RepID=UPI00241C4600|nr:hypothetical protein [Anaerocolumna sp. AGMB13025]WFR56315.1 hypothetical protein QA584_22270 [Anaerocolumna sp. AGMB13025]
MNINLKRINWDLASRTIIIIFFIVFMLLATLTPTAPTGESDDYMLSTISLENRFSLRMTEKDVEQAKKDFPEHYAYIRASWDNGMPDYFSIVKGEVYPWYMGTYSITCIPMKILLKTLGLSQSYAFAITNIFWYVLSLLVVFFKLKVSRKNVFFTILLLVSTPTVLYYFWPSAEIFIFSLVVISLVYFTNSNHKLAGLFVSLAGTLNPAIMAYGAVIILDYFTKMYTESIQKGEKNIINVLLKNIKDIIILIICFLPSLTTFIYNYIHFKMFNLQNVLGLARTDLIFERFLTYIFDLNLGFLPYFTIALFLFFVIAIYGIFKKDRMSLMFILAFLLTVLTYSSTWHINCGMTGIARYNAWTFPIMIFFLTTQATRIISGKSVKKYLYSLLLCSSILTTTIVVYIRKSETGMDYRYFSPIASKILDNFPSLYNPYRYTFISRTNHIDGGYWEETTEPVIYTDKDGFIRKILLSPNTTTNLLDCIKGSESDLKEIKKELNDINDYNKWNYINIGKNIELKTKVYNAPEEFIASGDQDIQKFTKGVYGNEGSFNWLSSNALICLVSKKIEMHGLNSKFNIPIDLNRLSNESLKIDFYVNDILVESIPINKIGSYNIHIDKNKIKKADDQYYEIKIITNGVYNPYKAGVSQDNRDLSIQLEYLG